MNKPVKLMFFDNGNTAVFNEQGEQIPELQQPWIRIFMRWLQSEGVEPGELKNITMPGGKRAEWHLGDHYGEGSGEGGWSIT